MKGFWGRIISVFACVAVLLCLAACDKFSADTVLRINGTDIGMEEYRIVMASVRSETVLYYSEKYKETDFGDSFWNKSYGKGEKTPAKRLKERTNEKLTENRVIFDWAVQEGLIKDSSFGYIVADMERENKERAQKIQNGQAVYGVSQFTAEQYYDYLVSNCSVEIRNIIAQKLTDSEIKDFYDKNKDELYLNPPVFECKQAIVKGDKSRADGIMKAIEEGTPLGKAAALEGVTVEEVTYDFSQIRTLSLELPSVSSALEEMKKGEIRLVQEYDDYYIVQVEDKKQNGYVPLNNALSNVQTALALERFDTQVAAKCKKAKISVNKEVFNNIGINGGNYEN